MYHETPSSPPPDEVLVSLGQLREALTALRNLEHLLGSLQVGPRVLDQVLPELEHSVPSWQRKTAELIQYGAQLLKSEQQLLSFERFFSGLWQTLEQALQRATPLIASAKVRLGLEREIQALLPSLFSALEHLELLLESTWAAGFPRSLHEVLRLPSSPGPERSQRVLPFVLPPKQVEIYLPVSLLFRSLGFLLSQVSFPAGLLVQETNSHLALSLEPDLHSQENTQIPISSALPHTSLIVETALRRYGVSLKQNSHALLFPLTASTDSH